MKLVHMSAIAIASTALATAPAWGQGDARLSNGAPSSFADIIEAVSPAVVSIDVEAERRVAQFDGFEDQLDQLPPAFRDLFREFANPRGGMPRAQRRLSSGSGFFISADGYAVTNFHVVDGATSVTISLKGGDEYEAEVVGVDEPTDLAVLKIDPDRTVPFVSFAETEPRVGDWVVAVGNPFRLGGTATEGIVSATGRELGGQFGSYNDFLQISAQINPGNSGGPTFNLEGDVVGVNAQISSPTGASVGIGFAIPADVASDVVRRLIDDGRVVRGWLGVSIQSVTDDLAESYGLDAARGALVGEVVDASPADDAGIQPDDVILQINGATVDDAIDLTRRVGALEVGERTRFSLLRDGRERTITVRIGERPASLGDDDDDARSDDNDRLFGLRLGRLDDEERTRLDLDADDGGLLIEEVSPGSEAATRGLRSGEAILRVNGDDVRSVRDFRSAVDEAQAAGRGSVRVWVTNGRARRFVPLSFESDD